MRERAPISGRSKNCWAIAGFHQTEIYTCVELTDLHEVIARCHPREKRR